MSPDPAEILGYTRHPASAAWPDLAPDDFATLRDSVRDRGQDHPIFATPDKRIVDGWQRLRVCAEVEVAPRVTVCHWTDPEIARAVIDLHKGRRHMTPGERADAIIRTKDACGLTHAEGGRPPAPTAPENPPNISSGAKHRDDATDAETEIAGKTASHDAVYTTDEIASEAGVSRKTAERRIQAHKAEQAGERPPEPNPAERIRTGAQRAAKRKRYDPLAEMQRQMEFWQELAESAQTELQTERAAVAALLAEDEDVRADAIAQVKNNADALASQNAALVEANKKLREERDAALEEARHHKEYAAKVEEGLRNLSERGG